MNSRLELTLDKHAFLHWAERQEGRFELKGNRVVAIANGTRNHAHVFSNIAYALMRRLDRSCWSVTAANFAVAIGEDIRYPDVLVERAGADGKALSTTEPVFIAEVLSPSSLALDLHDKAAEYMSLPSLEAYLVAAQDEPRLWLWQRAAAGARAFPNSPQELSGTAARLTLKALGVEVELAEIYAGIAPLA